MTTLKVLAAIRRRWTSLALVTVLALMAAIAYAVLTPDSYRARSGVFVSVTTGDSVADLVQGSTYAQEQAKSFARLVTAPAVLEPVVERLQLEGGVADLAPRVTAEVPVDTVVVEVSVTDPSPEQAALLADTVADVLSDVVEDFAPKDSDGQATVRVTMVAPAEVPSAPISPDVPLILGLGLLVGLASGCAVAWLREAVDTRVRDARSVQELTDAPVLGRIAAGRPGADDRLIVATDPRSRQAELFRQLRTSLESLRKPGVPLVLTVTSALPGEGKSTVALNLALAWAEVHKRVVLVDADLRGPTVAEQLGLRGDAGLSTVLLGRAEVDDVMQEWGERGLRVLTAGEVPSDPARLLDSNRMPDLVAALAAEHDVVIIDSSPVLTVADAFALSRCTSGALVVADTRRVRHHQLGEALRQLGTIDAPVLGVVLNRLVAERQVHGYGASAAEVPAIAARSRWLSLPFRRTQGTAAPERGAARHPIPETQPVHDRVPAGRPRA
ncbi:polysaccharide biosynthesis tyrosine autokinase [Geodermatophilus sp. SYSU D01180]